MLYTKDQDKLWVNRRNRREWVGFEAQKAKLTGDETAAECFRESFTSSLDENVYQKKKK